MATRDVIIYSIENQRFAIDVHKVERVIWVVEITPAPHSADHILGLINMQGDVIPVINPRRLLDLPDKEVELTDQLIICRFGALWIDAISEIYSCPLNGKDTINKDDEIILLYEWEKLIAKKEGTPV